MTSRTRYFLVGSSLIIVVGLGAGLVAYYNGDLPLRTSTIGPAELAYVPSDSSAIGYINVRQISRSDVFKTLQARMPAGRDHDELKNETGIDVTQDIDSVVSSVEPGTGPARSVVFLRGRFQTNDIEQHATAHGATAETYNGVRLLSVPGGPSVALLEPGLLGVGSEAALEHAIDVRASRDNVTKNEEMMKLVATASGEGNAWMVGRFDAVSSEMHMAAPVKAHLPPIEWFAVSADVDRGVNGRVYAEAKDDQSGNNLRAVVNGALAAARMMAGNNPKVGAVLGGLQATGTGKSVEVAFAISPDTLSQLTNGLPGMLNNLHSGAGIPPMPPAPPVPATPATLPN